MAINKIVNTKGIILKKNILITGCSSGLGLALTKQYLKKGFRVYGISRNQPKISDKNFIFKSCDLSKVGKIKKELLKFLTNIKKFETVYLNAGILGPIKEMPNLKNKEIKKAFNINLFAHKELLDILLTIKVKTVIAISSGAAVNASKGWGAYSLSKSSLNMLIKLYSQEMKKTKLFAIAPGVIKTPMTDIIRFEIDDEIFTSAKVLKNGIIQSPKEAAKKLYKINSKLKEFNSGTFIDIRNI